MSHENDRPNAWDAAQRSILRECSGRSIVEVTIEEVALHGPETEPVFTHPDIRFVQASWLDLSFDDGSAVRISTWQDDDQFALHVCHEIPSPDDHKAGAGIFRTRPVPDFPAGAIRDVQWRVDERGDIQEISLRIGDRTAILRAGEVEEWADGRLVVCERDESVLIFLNPEAYRDTVFGISERGYPDLRHGLVAEA